MKRCIICGEEDEDIIQEHHTVPRCILPEWKKTVHLCQNCHKKVHKYIIGDMVDIILGIRKGYDQMNKTFKLAGFIKNINFSVDELHKKILDVLILNKPISGYDPIEKLSVKEIVKQCGLDVDPIKIFNLNCQKIGYALKKMDIDTEHKETGKWVIYNRKTVNRLNKLQVIFDS